MAVFRVGQKVVCIDAQPHSNMLSVGWLADVPIKGAVYTVTDITQRPKHVICECPNALRFAEIKNLADVGYCAHRFRPIQETNIDVFRAMLKPLPVKEKVE